MPGNKRVIPRGEKVMNDKKVCDLTYTKLQIESNWKQGESHRYIYKENIKDIVYSNDEYDYLLEYVVNNYLEDEN